jgi:hypothetical protein
MAKSLETLYDLVINVDRKLDLHIQETKLSLEQIAVLDERQNTLLAEHMARSDALEKQNVITKQGLDAEINKLKKPQEALQWLYKGVLAIAALLAAVAFIQDKTGFLSIFN